MPPWLPEAGFGSFAGERRLQPAEIETFRRWVDSGALEGKPSDLPAPPEFADGWRLGTPDLVVKLPRPYSVDAEAGESWRNFVVPIPLSTRTFIRTIEIKPGNSRVVHHALVGVDPTRASRRRDAADPGPGFAGMDMGDSQSPGGHLLGWTPGMAPFPGVDGQAWPLEPGTDLVLQLHLTPSGKPEDVDPTVGFFFGERPAPGVPPLQLLRLDADNRIDIPAGETDFIVSDTFELPVDLSVLAVYPHAHFLATTMEAFAKLPDGSERWLVRIGAWDFRWQDIYRYTGPISLPRGSTITMRYAYDNSAGNIRNPSRPPRRVVAGLRSTDEMAHLQLQVQTLNDRDGLVLKEAVNRHMLAKNDANAWAWYELGNALRDEGRIEQAAASYGNALLRDPNHAPTHNNLGLILAQATKLNESVRHYREAVRSEPDFADAHYNLGNALRALGRFDEAREQFRAALKLEPGLAEAHNNLGEVLIAEGRSDEAIVHFREAVRIRPDSAEARNNLGAGLGLEGRFQEAIDQFREALRLDPAHARARTNLNIAMEKIAPGARDRR
jgi:tetratricopeptide (TPR) repeat protein